MSFEGVATDIDNILIWGSTDEEQHQDLGDNFHCYEMINLTLNKEMCKFKVSEVSYCRRS